MCWKEAKCYNFLQEDKISQTQWASLIGFASFAQLSYLVFFAVCALNSVQYVIMQKRYKSILLVSFYVLALTSLGAKNVANADNIYNYVRLYRNQSIETDNLRCTIDFHIANRSDFISSVLKLAIGYVQLVSINELSYAI